MKLPFLGARKKKVGKDDKPEREGKKDKKERKVRGERAEGSRWAAVGLFLAVVVVSLLFWIYGLVSRAFEGVEVKVKTNTPGQGEKSKGGGVIIFEKSQGSKGRVESAQEEAENVLSTQGKQGEILKVPAEGPAVEGF